MGLGEEEILQISEDGKRISFLLGRLTWKEIDILVLEHTLRVFNGNVKKTAESLALSKCGLYLKIKKYQIKAD